MWKHIKWYLKYSGFPESYQFSYDIRNYNKLNLPKNYSLFQRDGDILGQVSAGTKNLSN